LIADFEANNLRPIADRIWCCVTKNTSTGKIVRYYDNPDRLDEGDKTLKDLSLALQHDTWTMHNGIAYDRWLIKKVLGVDLPIPRVIDTLILSKMLRPDQKVPYGWKGQPAPHSVEAYGMRFGRSKPEHEDWSKFSPEMLYRCQEDVEIQHLIFKDLMTDVQRYDK